jgi:hypothetical protein
VVIDAEHGREDHSSIPHNCDQEGLKPLDARIDYRTRFKLMVKKKTFDPNFLAYKAYCVFAI